MRALALLPLFLTACPAPTITLTVNGSPEGASLFVRVFTPLALPACDDVAFGDLSFDNLAAAQRLEAPLADLAQLKLPFGQNALIVVEARDDAGTLLSSGCTTTVVPREDANIDIALENVAQASAPEAITLLKTDALAALKISDGVEVPLRIDLIRADGENVTARSRVRVLDRTGAELLRENVEGVVLDTLPLPEELSGPFLVEISPAWSNTALVLDGVAAQIEALSIVATGDVALVGERQGHAPTVISVTPLGVARSTVKREIVNGDAVSIDTPLNTNAFFMGAVADPAPRFVFFVKPTISDNGEYHLTDGDLVDLASATAPAPILRLPALSYEGCSGATKSLLVSHTGNDPLGTVLTVNGSTLTPVVVDPGNFQFEQVANMVCFGGGCVDDDNRHLSTSACGLFLTDIAVGQATLIGPVDAPELFVSNEQVIPGVVATDGAARERIGDEERMLISARHNDVVELNSYAIDVDDRTLAFRNLEAILPIDPVVIRHSASLFGEGADGVVVGIVVQDTARIVVLGPSREGGAGALEGERSTLRALGSITLPCEGCATSAGANASCAIRGNESCPPMLLIETGDVDADGASEIVVGGVANGARTFTRIDM